MLDGILEKGFNLLAGFLTVPLAGLFITIVIATYFGISQSVRFRSWFITLLTQADLLQAYIDIIRRAIKTARTLFYIPSDTTELTTGAHPRYTRFLALALAYATVWYIFAWSLGANLSIGSLDVLPANRAEDRIALLWMVAIILILVVTVTSRPGEFDRGICTVLGDTAGSTSEEAPDYPLFWRPYRPYKIVLGFISSIIIFVSLARMLEPWLTTWVSSPPEILSIAGHFAAFFNDPSAMARIALCLLVSGTVGFAVASIGHAFVAFVYVCVAAAALAADLPVHIAVPPMVAAAAFYRVQAPLIVTIFVTPIMLFVLNSLYVISATIDFWTYKMAFSLFLSLPIVTYVAILEEPIIFPGWLGKLMLGLLTSMPFSAVLLLRDTDFTTDHAKAIFVFWFVFPALNAAFDLIAWRSGIRYSERFIASAESHLGLINGTATSNREGGQQGTQVLIFGIYWGLRALVQALATVLIFAIVVPLAFIAVNALHTSSGFGPVIDPRLFIDSLLMDPFSSDVVWVTAMLLTPLIPSALNFGIAFFLVLLIPFSFLRTTFSDWTPNNRSPADNANQAEASAGQIPLLIGFLLIVLTDLLLLRIIIYASNILLLGATAWIQYSFQWSSIFLKLLGAG